MLRQREDRGQSNHRIHVLDFIVVDVFHAVKLAPEDSSPVFVLLGHRHLCNV